VLEYVQPKENAYSHSDYHKSNIRRRGTCTHLFKYISDLEGCIHGLSKPTCHTSIRIYIKSSWWQQKHDSAVTSRGPSSSYAMGSAPMIQSEGGRSKNIPSWPTILLPGISPVGPRFDQLNVTKCGILAAVCE